MARRAPRKAKVALYGTPNKAALVEDGATVGAVVGENLYFPDGRLVTVDDLAGGGSSTPSAVLSYTLWRLIGEIPANVLSVAALATQGLVTRIAGDNWTTRSVAVASTARLTVANGDGVSGNPTLDMADVDALSVWGRASGSSGKPAPIVAAANDRLLTRVAGAIAFTQLTSGMFPALVVPDAALSANVPLKNAANEFTANQSIDKADPVLSLNDTDGTSSGLTAYVSFEANGAQQGFVGFGSTNDTLYLHNDSGATIVGSSGGDLSLQRGGVTKLSLPSSGYIKAHNWIDIPDAMGLYSSAFGQTFNASTGSNEYWVSASQFGVQYRRLSTGAVQGYIYFDGTSFGLLEGTGNWIHLTPVAGGTTHFPSASGIRAAGMYQNASASNWLWENNSFHSFGTFRIGGVAGGGGYAGLIIEDGGAIPTFMSNGSVAGIFNQGDGNWMLYRATSGRIATQYQEWLHADDSAFISFYTGDQSVRRGYLQGQAAGMILHSEVSSLNLALITNGGQVVVSNDDGSTYAEVVSQESGSFTGSLSGMSSATSGTFYWSRTGSKVTMYTRSAITGTTNAATMQLSGIPASIRPAHAKLVRCGFLYSGTGASTGANIGAVRVNTDGTADFFLVQTTAAGIVDSNFASTPSTKGVANNWSITYDLD